MNNAEAILLPHHVAHLLSEGFTSEQIISWQAEGLRSLSAEEARKRGFKVWADGEWRSGSGIYFPFTNTFAQLRLDEAIGSERYAAKYLTPCKTPSRAYLPDGIKVITEGIKDAKAGCWIGKIPTGAIAGVSHYRKALRKGAGYGVIFDADGWHNPQVFVNLFNAGLWLNGKIQLLPIIPGYPKAGLCEFFKSGYTADDYRALIENAYTPKELLMVWPNHWEGLPDRRRSRAIATALNLAAKHLDPLEQDTLLHRIKKATSTSIQILRGMLQAAIAKNTQPWDRGNANQADAAEQHLESRFKGIATALKLDYSRCVTAQTFDGWLYRRLFEGGDGEWMVVNDAFYRYVDNGSWSHVSDSIIHKLIADASGDAYYLKYDRTFGWLVSHPYETDKYAASAFKFCRKRLVLEEGLPANNHLVAFKNVTVDMRTGETMPHALGHRITRYIPYDYAPNKECPEPFLNFVASAYGIDMLPVLRAFTSMFLDPTAPYGKFPHLIGASGSGKGTLGRLWNQMHGLERSASLSAFNEIGSPEGRYQYLTGKAICGFPDVGGYQEGLRAFYELVDNGALSGRALYSAIGNQINWNCRFWVASVDHLQVENAGDGWQRRVYPIPTLGAPGSVDPTLHLKLKECMADIISWALAMPREERDAILLSKPSNERVLGAIREAELYGDSARVFIDMCLRPTQDASGAIAKQDLHSRYVAFCKAFGYTPSSFTKFNNHLKTVLPSNHVDRAWSPMKDGVRARIPSHWAYLRYVDGTFENVAVSNNDGLPRSGAEPVWLCIKSRCVEGGLMDLEEFWNPSPPPDGGNGNSGNGNRPTEPMPPNGGIPIVIPDPLLRESANVVHPNKNGIGDRDFSSVKPAVNLETQKGASVAVLDPAKELLEPEKAPKQEQIQYPERATLENFLLPDIAGVIGKRIKSKVTNKKGIVKELRPVKDGTIPLFVLVEFDDGAEVPMQPENLLFEDGMLFPLAKELLGLEQKHFEKAVSNPTEKGKEVLLTPARGLEATKGAVTSVNYGTYPHPICTDAENCQRRAARCKKGMLDCGDRQQIETWKDIAGFSTDEVRWVYCHLLTPTEKDKFEEALKTEQLDIFAQSPSRVEREPSLVNRVYKRDELIAAIDREMRRLLWTKEDGVRCLVDKYGKTSRSLLSDLELIEFWDYLKGQPTPL